MLDKITTLKLVDNTDVFPNIKDENIPDTIMRIADLSKYLNQLKSINIGDIDSTTIASDIATFTNVHVDGNLFVNGIDNIVDKNRNKIINTGTFDPTSDNPAGQKSIYTKMMNEIGAITGVNVGDLGYSMVSLKLNRCKIRVGDKITALYIGNPQGENYTTSGTQTSIISVADSKGRSGSLLGTYGLWVNEYKNTIFTDGEFYDAGSLKDIIADWSGASLLQRLIFGGSNSVDSNRNTILYFTEPLTITAIPDNNSHFDTDFQGIVAFTNTEGRN